MLSASGISHRINGTFCSSGGSFGVARESILTFPYSLDRLRSRHGAFPMSTDPRSLLKTSGVYKAGFVTDIESDAVHAGLNEDVVRLISEKKSEPEWLL